MYLKHQSINYDPMFSINWEEVEFQFSHLNSNLFISEDFNLPLFHPNILSNYFLAYIGNTNYHLFLLIFLVKF